MSFFNAPQKSLVVFSILLLFVVIDNGYNLLSDRFNLKDIKHYYFDDYKGELKNIEKKYGINIIYQISSSPDFIGEKYKKAPYNCKFTKISDFELCRFACLLPSILDLYPEGVVPKYIDRIVFLGSLSFYNVDYAGTCLDNTLYLTSKGRNQGYSDDFLKELFHHEMSSPFFYKYDFDIINWNAANPSEFTYLKTDKEVLAAIQEKDDDKRNELTLYKQGFLRNYAKSTFENDFNTYAQYIFVKPEKMRRLVNQYPKIKQKYLIIKSCYIKIDPRFSTVFDKIL